MPLPVNIEDLLNKRKVESDRIEFKEGWNPDKIFRTIDAFANDFNNIGGGYIIIGVKEENGIAQRPVKGIPIEQVDHISQEIQKYSNKIEPRYTPRISPEEVDGVNVIVLWVPAGNRRPYSVAENVTSKHSLPKYFIRNGSTTIEAKEDVLDELRDMANRVPFDERGNPNITLDDINPLLVQDYLRRVGSALASRLNTTNLVEILDSMNLFAGSIEHRELKNVAAMMFCDYPDKFFPYTQVDVVTFPKGRINDPNNFTEVTFKGPVHRMIWDVLNHLKTTLIKEYVSKPKDRAESIRYFNYPYQAVEEAVVNSLYHRSYQEYEPVEITIEPNRLSILNYGGPDHSISDESLRNGQEMRTRRYRNRRIGDFLKEIDLTEARSTGIPTIQEELNKNGSDRATFETDERRSFFLIDIPCHPLAVGLNIEKGNTDNNLLGKELRSELERTWSNLELSSHFIDFENITTINDFAEINVNLQVAKEHGERLGEFWRDILVYAQQPVAKKEILIHLGLKNHSTNALKHIIPLLNYHLLDITEKEKNSPKQRYFTTELGKIFLLIGGANERSK